jgi:hypothetical protein
MLPISDGIPDSMTSIYRNHASILATARIILSKYISNTREVTKPMKPAAGIR